MYIRFGRTVPFGALASKGAGDPAFTVGATASSGLPVSFNIVSGPATISGNTVTLSGTVGTVVVRAAQGGNANYNAAANVDQSFSVGKLNQTITFAALGNKTFGDAAFSVSGSASSSLMVSVSIVSGPATISGNTLTLTGAGTVIMRAVQAGNATYNAAANVDQSFTVAKASQTINFGALANKGASSEFRIAASYSSIVSDRPSSSAALTGTSTWSP